MALILFTMDASQERQKVATVWQLDVTVDCYTVSKKTITINLSPDGESCSSQLIQTVKLKHTKALPLQTLSKPILSALLIYVFRKLNHNGKTYVSSINRF